MNADRQDPGKTQTTGHRFLVGLFILCLFHAAAQAEEAFIPVYHPSIVISRAAGEIKIDGELLDPGWRGAAKADNFAEHNPGDQIKPEVDTEVLITYDDTNLYIAWFCYDDPAEVRATFTERDRIFSDDFVMLLLDPFGEATHAYEIAANPYGIPGDLLLSTAAGEDISYNMIFETAGRITEFGWVVEMAIPFRSLNFPRQQEQEWRIDFWRNRPRESRFQYSWAAYDRNQDCWPCQWGTMTGISGVEPGVGFELLPAVVAHQAGWMGDNGNFENEDIEGDVSLGVKYDITSELSAEATINPDFSQVEADQAQIDVNSTFALFYPERRPFFQEGSDLFETYFNAVYTRSINDPVLAGKVIMRKGSNSLAYLAANDLHSVVIIPGEERSAFIENGESYSNILRFRHDLGEQSHIGIVGTDRRFVKGGSGSLFGVDGRIRFSASNSLEYQVLASHTEEMFALELADSAFNDSRFDGDVYTFGLDGETFWGHAWQVELERNTANYWMDAEYEELSPTFRADNGFEPMNNMRKGELGIGGIVRFDSSEVWENINGNVNVARKWNFDGVQKDEWLRASFEMKWRAAQTSMHANYLRSNELFRGTQFNGIWQIHN
jgi:hypothetical protein